MCLIITLAQCSLYRLIINSCVQIYVIKQVAFAQNQVSTALFCSIPCSTFPNLVPLALFLSKPQFLCTSAASSSDKQCEKWHYVHTEFRAQAYRSNWCDNLSIEMSRNNTVGIATGYRLDDRGVGVRGPVGSPRRPDQHWAHSAFYPMGIGGSFLGGKAEGA
jgi:hypothetical protein